MHSVMKQRTSRGSSAPARAARHNRGSDIFLAMACLHLSTAARLRRSALAAELPARACVLRALHTRRHGIPTAFVSLSGVTAMLSAAVRKA